MIIKPILLDNKSDLEFIEKLYIESFPPNERRSVLHMQRLMGEDKRFSVNVLLDEKDTRLGLLTYWTFDTFVFLEHFAIEPEFRSQGRGHEAIDTIINQISLPLIGEIEMPDTSILASKRMEFYKRSKFKVWDIPYEQPPYEEGFESVPMKLITYGDIDLNICFNDVYNQLCREVYKSEKSE